MLPITAILIDHKLSRIVLLKEAVESILNSTKLPEEILIILDIDPIDFEIYKTEFSRILKTNFSNIKILRNENQKGPAGARNYAILNSKNEWLAFLDSDDLWHPKKLEHQWNFMKKRPFLMASHSKELWIKQGKMIPTPKRLEPGTGRFLVEAFRRCLISMSSVLIKKQVFIKLKGFDEKLKAAEDYDFWIRYLIHYPISLIPNIDNHPPTIKRSGGWKQTSQTKNIDVYRLYSLLKIYSQYFNILSNFEKQHLIETIKTKKKIVLKQREKYSFPLEVELLYKEIEPILFSIPL
ncbi:MAG: glycosyltransferase family 2 protein [Leptonema sp. (in: bacteria)]